MLSQAVDTVLEHFESRLSDVVASLPLHLTCEHDIRRTFAETLLQLDKALYVKVQNLQYEKSGDGIPARKPVDLYFVLNDVPHFVEFKYWHTQVKMKSGSLEVGKGNATPNDYLRLKLDFVKQSDIASQLAEKLIIYMPQAEQYQGSCSEIVMSFAARQEPANARALFASPTKQPVMISHEGRALPFEIIREPVELASLDGIKSKLFTYKVLSANTVRDGLDG